MPRPHCPRCSRPLDHCLCALIPLLPSATRVLILQHPSELKHALNTARLAALGLSNAELRVGEEFEDLSALLAQPGYRACLLFPGEDTQPLQQFADVGCVIDGGGGGQCAEYSRGAGAVRRLAEALRGADRRANQGDGRGHFSTQPPAQIGPLSKRPWSSPDEIREAGQGPRLFPGFFRATTSSA